jgi:hypothetical protein
MSTALAQLEIPGIPAPQSKEIIPTPMRLIELAVQQGADVDKLEKLMALQERWMANEARIAFEQAMAAFKLESIQITRDKTNSQYGSKYVSLGQLVGIVTPFLSRHELSASWEIDQSAGVAAIKVTCIVTHRMGHSKSCSMLVPPDKSGAKNPIQEIKSAITYAKVCTFESACGLASSDANLDDDGNGTQGYTDLSERLEWISQAGNRDELRNIFQTAFKEAGQIGDKNAQGQLVKAKDIRFKELAR